MLIEANIPKLKQNNTNMEQQQETTRPNEMQNLNFQEMISILRMCATALHHHKNKVSNENE